jgi:hypothetical protein
MRPFPEEQAKSSTVPTLYRTEYLFPNDVGKDLPTLPIDMNRDKFEAKCDHDRDCPLLGCDPKPRTEIRVDWVEDIPAVILATASSSASGLQPQQESESRMGRQKILPCPPTSNGQSQWHPWDDKGLYTLSRSFEMTGSRNHEDLQMTGGRFKTPFGPRGGDFTDPYVRPAILPRDYHVHQLNNFRPERSAESRRSKMELQVYGNPSPPPISKRGNISGPRMMGQSRERRGEKWGKGEQDGIFASQANADIVSTRTGINIPTSTRMSMVRPSHNCPRLPEMNRYTNMRMNTVMHPTQRSVLLYTHNTLDYHPDPTQPIMSFQQASRGPSRPSMSENGDGTNHLQGDSPHHRKDMFIDNGMPIKTGTDMGMETRCQWRMIGTNSISNSHNSSREVKRGTGMVPSPLSLGMPRLSGDGGGQLHVTKEIAMSRETGNCLVAEVNHPSPGQKGLMRNCSRCKSGVTDERPHNIGGVIRMSEKLRRQYCGGVLVEEENNRTHGRNIEKSAATSTTDTLLNKMIPDCKDGERDHTSCCPECCREQDCHEGCLGHIIPSPSPNKPTAAETELSAATSITESTSVWIGAEVEEQGRLEFARSTFCTKRRSKIGKAPRPTGYKEQENAQGRPISLKPEFRNPITFLDPDGAGDVPDAVAAAKRATGFKVDGNEIVARKQRDNQRSAIAAAHSATAATRSVSESGSVVARLRGSERSANLAKRTASNPRLNVPNIFAESGDSGQSRNVSGASLLSIEIPSLSDMSLGALWEMLLMPLAVSVMWWRSHGEVRRWVWNGVEVGWEMAVALGRMGARVWWVGRIYGKTGRLRVNVRRKEDEGVGGLMWDVFKSVGYMGVFLAIAIVLGRVLRLVLGVLRVGVCVVRVVGWIVGQVFGLL